MRSMGIAGYNIVPLSLRTRRHSTNQHRTTPNSTHNLTNGPCSLFPTHMFIEKQKIIIEIIINYFFALSSCAQNFFISGTNIAPLKFRGMFASRTCEGLAPLLTAFAASARKVS